MGVRRLEGLDGCWVGVGRKVNGCRVGVGGELNGWW